MSWDPQKDLVPIISLAQTDIGLIVAANVPANDLNEFLQLARRARPPLSLGSAGQGNILHAYIELLKDATKADFLHVPYKGAADVAKDFVTGRVHLQFASSSAAQALARSGEVRLLGVVAPKRSDLFPELKTMSELGIQGMDIDTSLGLLGPAGMAPPVVARIADAARAVMGLSQVRSEFRTGGVEPQWAGPADYAQTLRDAYTGWGKLLAAVGYKKQ
jgi:tripartite-type tricarboxylate transporter receptor subunit TctC